MSHLFLIHHLGIWLLLSQVSTATPPGWWEEAVQICGHQLVRELIIICGQVTRNRPVRYPHWRSAEDSKPSPEELKDIIHNRQGEAENSLPKLEYLSLNTQSRKKRQINEDAMSEKCCQHKCTRRSILEFC
ncbi:prorelaxin H2-like [Callospermophilus lateralis]|uniref:prorelaxin H2-like n=1 Tax=Callospermophilus lateralis TaxID=76772 RepID=UPI004053B98D